MQKKYILILNSSILSIGLFFSFSGYCQSQSKIIKEFIQGNKRFMSVYRNENGQKINFYQVKGFSRNGYLSIAYESKIDKAVTKEGYRLLFGSMYVNYKPQFLDNHQFWGAAGEYCYLESDYIFIKEKDVAYINRMMKTDEVLSKASNDIFKNAYPTVTEILKEYPEFRDEIYDYYHDRYESLCGGLVNPNTNCHRLKIKINDAFKTYDTSIALSKKKVEEYDNVISNYLTGVGKAITEMPKSLSDSRSTEEKNNTEEPKKEIGTFEEFKKMAKLRFIETVKFNSFGSQIESKCPCKKFELDTGKDYMKNLLKNTVHTIYEDDNKEWWLKQPITLKDEKFESLEALMKRIYEKNYN